MTNDDIERVFQFVFKAATVVSVEEQLVDHKFLKHDELRSEFENLYPFLIQLCGENDAQAMHFVAAFYFDGIGVEPNYDTAEHWYEKAYHGGHAPSAINLWTIAQLKQDDEHAKFWYAEMKRAGVAFIRDSSMES